MFRRIVSGIAFGVATCAAFGLVGGCLTRPVVSNDPITKTNFITSIATGTIDKVDLLFDIDNSASMGDKQAYLAKAIPDLLTRLVQPNCVDPSGNITGQASLSGACTDASSNAEFPPVHNMHIGILSSSLGPRLGNECVTSGANSMQNTPQGSISRHNDDAAHLLNRTADPTMLTNYTEGTLADAPSLDNFLDWFPPANINPSNAGFSPTGPTPVSVGSGNGSTLNNDLAQLVTGVHYFGCGIESQLETWYRFLVQPDPYADLKTVNGKAQWDGVDTTILKQRADFLRPDSLVAVIVLTDENDSEVDVRTFGGTAWNFMTSPGFNPPRGTSICLTSPGDPTCTSCAFGKNGSDPQCTTDNGTYTDSHDWGYDLNLRHVHEKQKYGVSVQFPIQRYVVGLTSSRVPDRDGEYPQGASSYQGLNAGNQRCINPLFAAKLPTSTDPNWNPTADELCNLTPGPRKPGLVFYAHIGGVPHELLQVDPRACAMGTASGCPQKDALTDADWTLILGKDPENWDYTGIDPHMVEDYKPRTGAPVPTNGFPVSGETSPQGSDPINGREWITNSAAPNGEHQGLLVDREYSCIFKLDTPRDCSDSATSADPTLQDSCDCQPPNPNTGNFSPQEIPAVCDAQNPTQQDYAKAYPTIRELELARYLGQVQGANEGIISSLCPIHTTDMSADGMSDPLYGYRPAMNAIINKLKNALSNQCLPQRLTIDPKTNQVPCLILGTFSGPPGSMGVPSSCESVPGGAYVTPDPTVVKEFKDDQHGQWVQAGSQGDDPSTFLTCQVQQLPPNQVCNTSANDNGWCYIEQAATSKGCAQEILFSKTALAPGVVTSLQCLESSAGLSDGGAVVTMSSSSGGTTTTGVDGH